jgi:hypothetical protein
MRKAINSVLIAARLSLLFVVILLEELAHFALVMITRVFLTVKASPRMFARSLPRGP